MKMIEGAHMKGKNEESYEGFQLIETREIEEIEGQGKWFYHKESGVTVLVLQNQDRHKVFSITFMTLPEDNKGAAHIVEHTVCCASQKYPLKETFMAASQGSISTTINACTYPDRTMYYVASAHEKDLLGMADVFLDMVFHPCIEENSLYFLQEGWHYQYDEEADALDLSGVVYHEMLGEYGEASSYLERYELETLFADTCYQYDAGGLPEEIYKLSEAEFLAFYHKYYVGENATIILYGDVNLKKALTYLNEVGLKNVPKGQKCSRPPMKQPFQKPQYTMGYYPTELTHAPTLMSLAFVVGESTDCEKRLAFEMLEQMLLRSTASPLLKRLVMQEQLGMSLSDGGYDSCRMQPVFSITLKGADEKNAIVFEEITLAVLYEIAEKGLDKDLIEAAIESLEFELTETDASYEPIGLGYSEMMLSSYLYGGNPFNHIAYQKALAHIKAEYQNGYFEKLIRQDFLENTHRSLTVVKPSSLLQEAYEEEKDTYLEKVKAHLGKEGLEKVSQIQAWLEEEQLKENEERLLETLPQLTLNDMPTLLEKSKVETIKVNDCPVLFHEEATKDIVYLHFLWDAKGLSLSERRHLGLLAHIFSYMGTKHYRYDEIENKINKLSGGFHVAVHAYSRYDDYALLPVFKVSCKVLKRHLEEMMHLMTELFNETQFEEKDKLKELMGHIVYELERSFSGAPEYRATERVYAYLCPQGVYEDQVAGIAFYEFIKGIYLNFDETYETLKEELFKVMKEIFKKERLKIAVTAPSEDKAWIGNQLSQWIQALSDEACIQHEAEGLELYTPNEGIFNGQDGQAIAKGLDMKRCGLSYKGQYEVVANILENTYLWDRIRLQGGAYGCDVMLSREGYLVICSYCDPHLKTTLKTFDGIGDYLRHMSLSKKAVERTIVSTLGAMIAPCSVEQKSERMCTYFITGMPQEARQKIYDEIRNTTLEDLIHMSELFDELEKNGVVCVLGGQEKLSTLNSKFRFIDLGI